MAAVTVDSRVLRGTERLLARWRADLARGVRRVGWKVGINEPAIQRHLGIDAEVVGVLTSATELPAGVPHSLAGAARVGVEPELAIVLGRDVRAGATADEARAAVVALAPAIELIDLNAPFDDVERLVADNVYHRGVIFGPMDASRAGASLEGLEVRVEHRGAEHARVRPADALGDVGRLLAHVAAVLGAAGETLAAGDRVISGSLVRAVFVDPGDEVRVDYGLLGALAVAFVD
jgi:2-keto-4-pentenoate hydratase